MIPLFPGGVPGGTELIVILLIFLLGFVPLVVIAGAVYLFGKSRGKTEAQEERPDPEQ
jgi:flagellar basal body-associated protein FliL